MKWRGVATTRAAIGLRLFRPLDAATLDRFVDPYFRQLRRKFGPGMAPNMVASQPL